MKKVGIVMPAINLWNKYTNPAIDSVAFAMGIAAAKTGMLMHFLLIDNASTDETKIEGPKIESNIEGVVSFKYHRNEEMWGFQRSVNFGVKHFLDQGFDYVLVLNNDIVLHKNAIWRLVERFEAQVTDDSLGMVTCLDATGECERKPENVLNLDDVAKEDVEENAHPCFSAFMINKHCWETVGDFDELFHPAYYEDNDYHYRMQLAGLLAITYPPAMFFHWGSATQLEALGRPLTDSANQHANYRRKWGGDPGKEVFTHPFNNEGFSIKSTKQNENA